MDSFEFNKMAGALLGALVLTMGMGFVADVLFYHPTPAKPGYDLPVPKATEATTSAPAPQIPLPVLLAKANPQQGENDAKVCEACHNFEKGAGPKIGPPLYGVVGRPVASIAGFDYSDALKKKGGDWTFAKLFQWINDPQAYAPGTKMTFAGEPDPQKRADILVYLRTLSDKPVALPVVTAADKAAAAAPPPSAAPAAAAAKPAAQDQLPALLAKANPDKGKEDAQVCQVCHNVGKGEGAKIGPPLYGVVGRQVASVPGFDYSDVLKSKGGVWTFAKLFEWIKDPQAYAPGTKMTFAGEPSPQKRADILAYLRTLADKPVPLPAVASADKAPAPTPAKASAPVKQPAAQNGAPPAGSTR